MAISKEKELWKVQSKYDKDGLFNSSDMLLNAAREYFEWSDKHPLYRPEAVKSGAECGRIIDIPLRRPYTLNGFCEYIGCSVRYFERKKTGASTDVREAMARIENTIRTYLFEGAATGILNSSIVSKWIGDNVSEDADESSDNRSVWHIEVLNEEAKQEILKLRENPA